MYGNAEDLIWWADFRLQDIQKQRGRRKTKAKEGRQKEEEETWKHEKPPPFWWAFFLANFCVVYLEWWTSAQGCQG